MEIQVNIESDPSVKSRYIDQDVNSQNAAPEEEEREFKQLQQHQPQSSLSDSEISPITLGIDWDQNWESRFWARIMDERRQRQQELLLIEQKRQELDVEIRQIAQIRRSIDQYRYDLQELEPFIPVAMQLQAMKIDQFYAVG